MQNVIDAAEAYRNWFNDNRQTMAELLDREPAEVRDVDEILRAALINEIGALRSKFVGALEFTAVCAGTVRQVLEDGIEDQSESVALIMQRTGFSDDQVKTFRAAPPAKQEAISRKLLPVFEDRINGYRDLAAGIEGVLDAVKTEVSEG